MRIETVKKINANTYILNDSIVISNIKFEEEGVSYSINYDETKISEEESYKIADVFFREALEDYLEKLNLD